MALGRHLPRPYTQANENAQEVCCARHTRAFGNRVSRFILLTNQVSFLRQLQARATCDDDTTFPSPPSLTPGYDTGGESLVPVPVFASLRCVGTWLLAPLLF